MIDIALVTVMTVGLYGFYRYPTNIAFIIAALNSIFLIFPALWYIRFSPEFLEYSATSLRLSRSWSPYDEARLWVAFISGFWLLGAFLSTKIRLTHPRPSVPKNRVLSPLGIVSLVAFAVLIFVLTHRDLNLSIAQIILPARIERGTVNTSEYILSVVIAIPTAVACLIVIGRRKITLPFLVVSLMALMFALSTAQRRTFILVAASIGISVMVAGTFGAKKDTRRILYDRTKEVRIKLLSLFVLMACLGPILWVARNYSTRSVRGDGGSVGELASIFEMRGFWELFFGSAAGGFPMTVLALDMLKETTSSLFYSGVFIASVAIPRAVWPNKPLAPGALVEAHYDLVFSPSLFLIPELLLNFYWFAPLVALVFSYFIGRVSVHLLRSISVAGKQRARQPVLNLVFYSILTPMAAMMFKNGFTIFFVSAALWLLVAYACYLIATRKA